MQDVPSLSISLWFIKSAPCQRRNSCPEVRRMGLEKSFHMISKEFDWYPSILYLNAPPFNLGIRISSVEFVKNTSKLFALPQPQFDHRPRDTSQDTCQWRWISLTASIWPPTSTTNAPNWLSLAPNTGFEFSLRHGRSAINQKANSTGEILKTHVVRLGYNQLVFMRQNGISAHAE